MEFEICEPILGFEDLKYVKLTKIDDIFMTMQSVENEKISFTLIDPFVLIDYDFEISENIRKKLEITMDSNILVLNIVIIQNPIEESIVNFLSPILFNTDSKKAAQVVLPESSGYGVSEKISKFLKKQ
ncbi:Flagellar assembly factor FliW [hydrothermal vent metagenome]|uniref:Flagellar assembly factor FliW n=1 Tax=hydrothermal vent metagenome TaxID=652676 RepID=A0A1W1D1E6_9ZZZZ